MGRSLEEKRKAAAEASRRWRERHPEKAKQVERDAYHRRQQRLGKDSGERESVTDEEKRSRARQRKERWRKANPERWNELRRGTYARHRDERLARLRVRQLRAYGLTPEQFAALGDRCGICGSTSSGRFSKKTGREYPMHVDHCHDTQKVRGLLCVRCNVGIGYFKHDVALLEKAIDYLRRTA